MRSANPGDGWRGLLTGPRLPQFALLCLGAWLHAADALVTATIMPSVGVELGGYAYFAWAVAGYYTGSILAGATAGRLSEMMGLRPALAASGLAYAAACLISALAPNIGLFLLGRLLQGVAGGWIAGLSYVVIGLVFPQKQVVRVLGAVSAVWGAATLGGPLVGGLFAEAGNWRGVFWTFSGQAVVFAACAAWLMPRAGRQDGAPGVPLAQMALLGLAVLALAAAGLAPRWTVALALVLVGAGLLLTALRLDGRARAHLLPRRAGDLRSPIGLAYAAAFLLPAAGIGFSTYGPAILQLLRDASPLTAGYVVAAEALGWSIAALAVTHLPHRWAGGCIRAGGLLILAGLIAFALLLRTAPLPLVVVIALAQGAGFGVCWGFLNARAMAALGDDERAIGSSGLGAMFSLGSAAGAAIAGIGANRAGLAAGPSLEVAQAASLWVFVAALPVGLAGAAAAWRLGARRFAL